MTRARRMLGLAVSPLVAAALSCALPTADRGGGPIRVYLLGQWDYTAVQTSPANATLAGVLVVTSQSGTTISGTLDVTETSGPTVRTLDGVVSGQAPDSADVDFDAFFDVTGRRHLGAVDHDTLGGTWVEQSSGGELRSGTFRAVRRTPT